ncbi:hypothetical protein FF100_22395 [Methylobacterium terricola]|uniref:Uncharacterized protein n=1 Tax=Methylobacterium terricola TaxID=2583531 RepID=A0A5C4LCY8_9HYPH|nr:hypothetical protein [Methylobacterium terricola]TNC10425.1 hypothetical protein FF100_22395 [Methylobacterium terricola]
MNANLSRADRRRFDRFCEKNEPTLAADRRFFERRPDRTYRVRLASAAEVETLRLTGRGSETPAGYRWYVAIRHVVQDVRVRAFAIGRDGLDTDVSDAVAANIYGWASGSIANLPEFESALREQMAGDA